MAIRDANRKRALAVVFSSALAAAGLLAACTLLNPLDDYTNGVRADGGLDATSDVGPLGDGGSNPCALRLPPERPTTGEGSGPPLTLALANIAFDSEAGFLGYDLDRQCTCQGGTTSCTNPKASTASTCDLPNGVDNSGSTLYRTLANQARIAGYNLDPAGPIKRGRATILLRLSDWNGTPNDATVVLGLVYSFGTDGSQDAGSSFWSEEAGTVPPKGDGNDAWTYDPDSLPNGTPRVEDRAAYVRDGVLVGRFSSFALALGVVRFVVQDVVLTGKLVAFPGGGAQITDGIIQGRDGAEDMLTQFQLFRSPVFPYNPLCRDDQTYKVVETQICSALDVRKAPGDDNKGLPCEAVSIGFNFQAIPAKLGPAYPPPPREAPCDDPDAGPWVGRCP